VFLESVDLLFDVEAFEIQDEYLRIKMFKSYFLRPEWPQRLFLKHD